MVSSSCLWSVMNVILLSPLPLLFPFSIRWEKLEEEEEEEDWPETDLPWRRRGVPSRSNTWGAGFCSEKDMHRLSTMTSKRRSYAAPIRTSLWFSGLYLALSKTRFPLDSSSCMPPMEMPTEPKAFSARRYRFAKALTDSLLCLTNGFVLGHEFSLLINRFWFVNPTSTSLQCNQFQMLSWFYLNQHALVLLPPHRTRMCKERVMPLSMSCMIDFAISKLPFQKWSQVLLVVPPLRRRRGSTASKPHPRLWSHATIPGSWRVAGRFSAGMRILVVIRRSILQGLQNMSKLWLCRCVDSILMRSGSSSSSSSVSSSRCRFILRFYNWINGSCLWFSLLTTFPVGPMIWWRRRDRAMRFMKTMWMIMRLNMGSEHPNAFFCFPANHAIYLVVLLLLHLEHFQPSVCQTNVPWSQSQHPHEEGLSLSDTWRHQLLFCRIIPILRPATKQVEVGLVWCCSARERQIGDNRHGQAPLPTDGNPVKWKRGPKWMRGITPQLVTPFYLSVILAQDPKWRQQEEDDRSTWQETMKRMQNSQH